HGPKRLTAEVHIQPGRNHTLASLGKFLAHVRHFPIEKLDFVNCNHVCIGVDQLQNLTCALHWHRPELDAAVRTDAVMPKACIEFGLKYLHFLPGNLSALDPADQLLRFAAEHAAADDLDPSTVGLLFHEF